MMGGRDGGVNRTIRHITYYEHIRVPLTIEHHDVSNITFTRKSRVALRKNPLARHRHKT